MDREPDRPIRVLHVPFAYLPDPIGGTEVYVRSLALGARPLGVESAVCAPGGSEGVSEQEGLRVHRFEARFTDASSLHGRPERRSPGFDRILDRERPDLVHFHAFVGGLTAGLADAAVERGVPYLFTYHTPSALCSRGDLLYNGGVCDGRLEPVRCAACVLRAHGVPRPAAGLMAAFPASMSLRLSGAFRGRVRTALTLTSDLARHRAAFRGFADRSEKVVAVCGWAVEVLARNGVPPDRVLLSRHGIETGPSDHRADVRRTSDGSIRLVYAGRFSPIKGTHLVISALRSLPRAPIELDIIGRAQSASDEEYLKELKRLSDDDNRIRYLRPYAAGEGRRVLSDYDAVVVPSVWMETGPLVVLEAFAAGVPVIASRRGGILEIVREDVDALLVEPGSVASWTETLRRIGSDPDVLGRMRREVRPPRSSITVAEEMSRLYRAVLAEGGKA